MIFELDGEPERVIRAGEAFWEPGGDVIHYQSANNLSDAWSRLVVTMTGVPGEPMLTLAPRMSWPNVATAGRRGRPLPDHAPGLAWIHA